MLITVIIIIVTISNINFITSACKDNDSISKGIDDVDLPYFNNDDDHIVYYGDGIETLDSHQKRQHDMIDVGVYHEIIHNNDNLQSFFNLRPLLYEEYGVVDSIMNVESIGNRHSISYMMMLMMMMLIMMMLNT
jgi:hypothetical protein